MSTVAAPRVSPLLGQGKRAQIAAPFPCTPSLAHLLLHKENQPQAVAFTASISGSLRIGMKLRFQAHLWIGKCYPVCLPPP
jgi:hypothetical protein